MSNTHTTIGVDSPHTTMLMHTTRCNIIGCNADLLLIVMRAISDVSWIMPRWCATIIIRYANAEPSDDAYLRVFPDPVTSSARIEIFDSFFAPDLSRIDRAALVAHELIHIHISMIMRWSRRIVERRIDGPSKDDALDELEERHEMVVVGLEQAFRVALERIIETEQ